MQAPSRITMDTEVRRSVGRPVRLDGPEITLHGYWASPRQDYKVEIPLLSHGYFPKIDHTPDMVRSHIIYRRVTVPSIKDLKANGLDTDRVIFLTEINVHPRHEKNTNFFQHEFPSMMRSLARREGITFIVPAMDVPSAKLQRKKILGFWRNNFTPLFMKGRHFTSGRMQYFVIPANKEVLTPLKRSLHLESTEEENTLVEYNPHVMRSVAKNKKRYSLDPHKIRKNRQREKDVEVLAAELSDMLSDDLDQKLAPIVNRSLRVPVSSRKNIESLLGSDEAGESLRREVRKSKGQTRQAAKAWVAHWLVPRLKELLGNHFEEVFSASVGISLSLATHYILTRVFKLRPELAGIIGVSSGLGSYSIGGVSVSAKAKHSPYLSPPTHDEVVGWAISWVDRRYPKWSLVFRALVEVKPIRGQGVSWKVGFNGQEYRRLLKAAPDELEGLHDQKTVNSFLSRLNSDLRVAIKSGEVKKSSDEIWDFLM